MALNIGAEVDEEEGEGEHTGIHIKEALLKLELRASAGLVEDRV